MYWLNYRVHLAVVLIIEIFKRKNHAVRNFIVLKNKIKSKIKELNMQCIFIETKYTINITHIPS